MSTPAPPTSGHHLSASANPAVHALLQHPALWRARSLDALSCQRLLPALQPTLTALLPGGGWPRGQLTEVLLAQPGLGELSLLLPALAGQTQDRHWCACVNAPADLYAPALHAAGVDSHYLLMVQPGPMPAPASTRQTATTGPALWAYEQVLRSPALKLALGWFDALSLKQMRRLQLAAETGGGVAIVFSPARQQTQASPAALRLLLQSQDGVTTLTRLKWRGEPALAQTLNISIQGLRP